MLTQGQAQRIEQAVQAAEAATSTEIAVCVRRASGDDRFLAAIFGAVVFLAVETLGPAIWWNYDRLVWLGVALVAGVLAFWLCDRFDLGLRCLPPRMLVKDAHRTARAVFLDHGIDATPERNAVLLFVSQAERYVEILPDRAAAAAIEPTHWTAIVGAFRQAARKGDLGEAVAGAVSAIGKVCAVHFPPSAGNPDRVSNRPIQG
ncbi:MAG TPA: TPM domain-containing protein [Dongiaceae bacterium]|nr:TPM domain-containing protein [Dongiaceae bacterium]